jgi:hypothetical protein
MPGAETRERAGDEASLAIEHVVGRIGALAVDQQGDTTLGHGLEHLGEWVEPGDAGFGVGRRSGGVQLDRVLRRACERGHVRGRGRLGQVQGHQWLEARAGRARREDPLAIGERVGDRHDRRTEVRHHDRTTKARAGVGEHCLQACTVAQVQVPVVRPADGEFSGHRSLSRLHGLR